MPHFCIKQLIVDLSKHQQRKTFKKQSDWPTFPTQSPLLFSAILSHVQFASSHDLLFGPVIKLTFIPWQIQNPIFCYTWIYLMILCSLGKDQKSFCAWNLGCKILPPFCSCWFLHWIFHLSKAHAGSAFIFDKWCIHLKYWLFMVTNITAFYFDWFLKYPTLKITNWLVS